jgi:hypothetical protein
MADSCARTLAVPLNSYLRKHEQLMSKSDALLSLDNSRRTIWASIAGGTIVFAGKLCVVMYCGGMGEASDSIVAETAHSFVDVLNQVFLLVGIQRSQRPISDLHPRGTVHSPAWHCLSILQPAGRPADCRPRGCRLSMAGPQVLTMLSLPSLLLCLVLWLRRAQVPPGSCTRGHC